MGKRSRSDALCPRAGKACDQRWTAAANLFAACVDAEDFAEFAFGADGEGAAADFAVGGELLARNGGVEFDLTILAAVWALDCCGILHTMAGVGLVIRS